MKRMREYLVFGLLVVLGSSLWAAPNSKIEQLVNPNYYDKLLNNGVVTIYKDDGSNKLELLPKSVYADKIKANILDKNEKNYPFTYESLYLKSKADLLESSKSSANQITLSDISRVCRSISKMEGMKYYSTTKKKELVLYEKAYMIDGPNGKQIEDLNKGNADGQVSYCYQNDNSFGDIEYVLNYRQSKNEMMAVFTNISTIGLGPFKAIYPDMMRINILVIDCGEDILFYICCDLDSVKFPGIKAQITDSMTSRMDAIYHWFIRQF